MSLRTTFKMTGAVVQEVCHCGFLIICFVAALGANQALQHYAGRPPCRRSLAPGHLCHPCSIATKLQSKGHHEPMVPSNDQSHVT